MGSSTSWLRISISIGPLRDWVAATEISSPPTVAGDGQHRDVLGAVLGGFDDQPDPFLLGHLRTFT